MCRTNNKVAMVNVLSTTKSETNNPASYVKIEAGTQQFISNSSPTTLMKLFVLVGIICSSSDLVWAQPTQPSLFDYTPNPSAPSLFDYQQSEEELDGSSFSIRAKRDEGSYRVGPGDRLAIEIVNVPEFSGEQVVLPDGTIRLPLIDNVSVQGLTLNQITQELATRYIGILKRPVVTVSLLDSARPLAITVAGEVNRPGVHTFNLDGGENPSVFSAIQAASGITPEADVRRIEVRRRQVSGEEQIFTVDFWEILQGGSAESVPILLDGDVIQVETANELPLVESSIVARSNLSPDNINVNVVGEITSPGQKNLPPVTSLNQAILSAGGFTRRANSNEVELLRINPDGTTSRQIIQVDLSAGLGNPSNPTLQNTDVIVVNPSGIASFTDTFSEIISPLNPIARVLSIIRNIRDFDDN